MFHWISFLTYAIITAATPGPNNIMSMSHASQYGFKKSYPFNLGIWLGFTIVATVCTILSNTLHAVLPLIKLPMLIIGAAYMLFLAWKTWRSQPEAGGQHAKNGFLAGMILQFINPKAYIYCIVSMEAYILPLYQGNFVALSLFAILLSTIGFLFTLCWALFGSLLKHMFFAYAKLINSIMALLLIYCAVSLFL